MTFTTFTATDRTGFKAGALENGNKTAKGELLAIFDADFVPKPDCLRKLVDFFTDPLVGCAQMRWSHINGKYNLLTRLQTIMLDGHFVVEQTTRNRTGGFFNFNGTAGIWRRNAIEMSGGWQHDTLTEDTDLSFRAQLMGWKFVYLLDEEAPAEIPVEINAFKAQQRRWAKGVMQVGIKLYPRIWHAPLPLRVRLEMFFRLTGNISYPLMIVASFLQFPLLLVRYNQPLYHLMVLDLPLLVLLDSFRRSLLRHGGLVSRRKADAAAAASAAGHGPGNRAGVFQCARCARSAAGSEVRLCAHAEVPRRRDQRRNLEAQKVQTKAWLVAAARIELCRLFHAGDHVCGTLAHVGNNSFSDAVLLRLWLHGPDESAADHQRQTLSLALATRRCWFRQVTGRNHQNAARKSPFLTRFTGRRVSVAGGGQTFTFLRFPSTTVRQISRSAPHPSYNRINIFESASKSLCNGLAVQATAPFSSSPPTLSRKQRTTGRTRPPSLWAPTIARLSRIRLNRRLAAAGSDSAPFLRKHALESAHWCTPSGACGIFPA